MSFERNSSRNGGVASYVVPAVLATLVGASVTWLLLPRPDHGASVREAVTTHGEWVHITKLSGDSIRAYVAYPERKDRAPAVIVIHEVFGLTDWEPTVADRLARNGFVAVVPDLLSSRFGITPSDPDSGRKLTAQLLPDDVTGDLEAVYGYLNGLPAVRRDRIGTIGFCWGGAQSFRYATNNPKLGSVVVCYGSAPDSTELARIRSPVLGIYGEDDARINTALPGVEAQMKRLGKTFSYNIYPGTGHGFLKPGRKGAEGDQPEKAWARVVEFYGKTLGR